MKKIEIFTTPVCHYCHLVKDFLQTNKIEFTQYDVTKDMDRRQELMDLGAMGVPLIRISGDGVEPIILNGFGEEEEEIISKEFKIGKFA